jgi:hypothetical protein
MIAALDALTQRFRSVAPSKPVLSPPLPILAGFREANTVAISPKSNLTLFGHQPLRFDDPDLNAWINTISGIQFARSK